MTTRTYNSQTSVLHGLDPWGPPCLESGHCNIVPSRTVPALYIYIYLIPRYIYDVGSPPLSLPSLYLLCVSCINTYTDSHIYYILARHTTDTSGQLPSPIQRPYSFIHLAWLFLSVTKTYVTQHPVTMCTFTKNYYIYASCQDPGLHYFRTSMEGNSANRCSKAPHERYIVQPGSCPLCCV